VNVQISVPGTFFAFTLGEQLDRENHLSRIYTTKPDYQGSIPGEKIDRIRHPALVEHLGNRFPVLNDVIPSRWSQPLRGWKNRLFDRAVARRLNAEEDGLFVGYAGVSLEAIKTANELGLTTAVERLSSHARTQQEILQREYEEFAAVDAPVSEAHVAIEEEEYERADVVLTPSAFAQESFLDRGFSQDEVHCIPYGVELPEPRDDRTPDLSEDGTRYFIFPGHVTLRKGIQYLLPAWRSLDLDDAELIITGGIDEAAKPLLDEHADAEDIHVLGWVDDLDAYLDAAEAMIFPTLEEGSARVVYEGMAAGLPPITTHNSGWVGEDGEHGIEIPIRDPEAIAAAIRTLYDDPSKATEMGGRAQELIRTRYTESEYGSRAISVYESLLEH